MDDLADCHSHRRHPVVLEPDPDRRYQGGAEVQAMIPREEWEEAVKEVRRRYLEKAHDMQIRRMTAGILDAAFDDLYEELDLREFMTKFK